MTPEGTTPTAARVRRVAPLLAVCAGMTACEQAEGTSDDHFDAFAPLEAVPEIRIGDIDDPDVGFSGIGGVDIDRDGNIYVLESSVPEIRVYDATGQVIGRIGKQGQGPGEFEGAPRFGVVGDTVWTFDHWNTRVTLFRRDGTLISSERAEEVRIPLPSSYGWLVPWIMRPDGKLISHFGRVGGSGRDDPPGGVEPADSVPVPFLLFDGNGEVSDTIGWAPRPPPRMWRPPGQYDTERRSIEIGGRRTAVPRPPTAMPWWEAQADGYILIETPVAQSAEEGVLTVSRFRTSGDTVYSRKLRYRPEPYTDEGLDSIAARASRGEPGGMVPTMPGRRTPPDNWRAIARVLRNEMSFPLFQLPIQRPWVGRDGSIWLRRWDGTSPSAEWFLLDPSGRAKGLLELPPRTRPQWSGGDIFWAVEYDDLDVPWLVRYRIRPTESP